MNLHESYVKRCLQLAGLGAGHVAPNPMVGSVLVYENKIIGEGYHKQYGHPHAEVNCLASVSKKDSELISKSTLYVSLEPCAHFGKTPPCADLIIQNKIPKVVVGCRDPFEQVNGKGIEKLQAQGVEVVTGILEEECRELNKNFFNFHQKNQPYIILKWAQSTNSCIANDDFSSVAISNAITNRLVHRWRSEEVAIMVGTNTAFYDNPQLNARLTNGPHPLRMVLDLRLRLPISLSVFDRKQPTIVFNSIVNSDDPNLKFVKIDNENVLKQVLNYCYKQNIQSILVEGGAALLNNFIKEGLWDEARIITNTQLQIEKGIAAPVLMNAELTHHANIFTDTIQYFRNKSA